MATLRQRNQRNRKQTPPTTPSTDSTTATPFVFQPPLPTLWSSHEVSPAQLEASLSDQQAAALYANVLQDFNIHDPTTHSVPRRPYGSSNSFTVPLLSLGGFVALGSSVMRNRKLKGVCGCNCKGRTYFAVNGLLIPILLGAATWAVAAKQNVLTNTAEVVYCCGASVLLPCVWFVVAAWMINYEHQQHLDRLFDYSHAIGMDHVETARHYMESEAQLNPVLQRQQDKGQEWIVQTKVRPYAEADAFYKTAKQCLVTLGQPRVQLLTVHGVNIQAHVEACLNNSIHEISRLKTEGCCDLVGFAAHCHTTSIVKLIETNRFDFVNLHFGFFSSYSNIDNQAAVLAASKAGMGVYCISPSNQGGELHAPSPKLIELCAPLHPLEFGLLYLMTHPGIGDCGTVSCGPTDYTQLDYQLRAIQLLPHAAQLLPPIVDRLRKSARHTLGKEWCNGLAARVSTFTQGNEAMPGALSLSLLMGCHGLWKAFDNKSYLKRMVENLSWPGDWCAGGGLEVLRGKTEESSEMKQFRVALQNTRTTGSGGAPVEEAVSSDRLLAALRELEQQFPAPVANTSWGKKMLGLVLAYGRWWVATASALSGYVPTQEYGSMPKTRN